MNTSTKSEEMFSSYLDHFGIKSDRNYVVNHNTHTDVDFRLHLSTQIVLADVKEVRDIPHIHGKIVAAKQIISDLKKLRAKFKDISSIYPIVLVTANLSSTFFTGVTVVTAMLGKLQISFRDEDFQQITPLQHGSNASFTRGQNTTISGILVLQPVVGNSYFSNPYARIPLDGSLFPETKCYHPKREDIGEAITLFSNLMF